MTAVDARPDGSFAREDPREQARQLQAEVAGWVIWWGPRTGRFFAITRTGPVMLVEARDTGQLVERMAAGAAWAVVLRK